MWSELGHTLVRLIGSPALYATLLELVCHNVCATTSLQCVHTLHLLNVFSLDTWDIITLCYWAFYNVSLFLQVLTSGALTAVVYTPNRNVFVYECTKECTGSPGGSWPSTKNNYLRNKWNLCVYQLCSSAFKYPYTCTARHWPHQLHTWTCVVMAMRNMILLSHFRSWANKLRATLSVLWVMLQHGLSRWASRLVELGGGGCWIG